MTDQPILLDCTRMVTHRWSGRTPTGIDRVCDAYRAHFAERAQAVVQLRGRVRVLSHSQSERLFGLLEAPGTAFRRRFATLAAAVCTSGHARGTRLDAAGRAVYLNVSHTDFDLESHFGWVRASGIRPVYLLHDLIPIEHPHWTTPRKSARHHGRVRHALTQASGIIANSHTTARALDSFARAEGLAAPPILGAPLGVSTLSEPASCRLGRPSRDATFVCLSTIEQRKNHMLLFDVWQRLIARHGDAAPRLLLIGRWGIGSQAVRRRYYSDPQLQRFITIMSNSSDTEIAHHLRAARALLAPSRAEGFGLPVVEALKLGVPVVASDLPAFREAGGTIPTFLAPTTPEPWLRTIEEFAAKGPDHRRQTAALKSYRAPDWRDHFALVDKWLDSLPQRADLIPSRATNGRNTERFGGADIAGVLA